MNAVHLLGKVVNDPQLRYTKESKKPVVNLMLLTRETWIDKSNKGQSHVDLHRIVLWGAAAVVASLKVKQHDVIAVDGRLTQRAYEKDGETRHSTEVTVTTLHLPDADEWYGLEEAGEALTQDDD